jgi:hypothetical protein
VGPSLSARGYHGVEAGRRIGDVQPHAPHARSEKARPFADEARSLGRGHARPAWPVAWRRDRVARIRRGFASAPLRLPLVRERGLVAPRTKMYRERCAPRSVCDVLGAADGTAPAGIRDEPGAAGDSLSKLSQGRSARRWTDRRSFSASSASRQTTASRSWRRSSASACSAARSRLSSSPSASARASRSIGWPG